MGRILVLDDDAGIRMVVAGALARAGHQVDTADTLRRARRLAVERPPDAVVTDVLLPDGDGLAWAGELGEQRPGLPVLVMSAENTLATAVAANARGAFDYLPKPFDLDELVRAVAAALDRHGAPAGGAPAHPQPPMGLIGRSPAMQEVYRLVARVVPTELSVLLLGESGTGKEVVARAIHALGPRGHRPFVAVNMAALPRDLVEAELFGHERGAFTGAVARNAGRFTQAEGGTLFLDEIGDMPADAQTRLLRVLQEGEYTPVGGRAIERADVRVLAATHQDLERRIAEGRFREDLYYRLCVVPIGMPPLRARAADIPELALHFLALAAQRGLPRRTLDPDALAWLQARPWPGNVRELENAMMRVAALARDDRLSAAALARWLEPAPARAAARPPAAALAGAIEAWLEAAEAAGRLPAEGLYDLLLPELERPLLRLALAGTRGNQLRAARRLGINRNTLKRMLDQLGIGGSSSPRG